MYGKNSKRILKSAQKKQKVKAALPEFEGKARMTRDGSLYVEVEGREEDIYVRNTRTGNALNGDTVRVRLLKRKGRDARVEGEVREVLLRSKRPHIGVLHFVGTQAWVLMQSRQMPHDISVEQKQALDMGGKQGYKVAVVIEDWPRNSVNPLGKIVDVLGTPGENDTEMHAILAEYGLPYRFDPAVEKEAGNIPVKISKKDLEARRDFRNTLTFTIDPADAKDFDDALSFVELPNGNYEVGVHIADVSHYVTPGTLIDKEAEERGTSVYLVDRTVPMLPEVLCNNLCSLRPKEEKLAFSAVFEINPRAKVEKSWLGRTVIESDYRFDYDGAQKIIEASRPGAESAEDLSTPVAKAIIKLDNLASQLRSRRFKNGAISFDRPEMKVDVDASGKPTGVHEHVTVEANWLIEEFMLLANRTVAEWVATGGKMNGSALKNAKTFVYRVHDEPNMIKLEGLRDFAKTFGYKLGELDNGKKIARSLNELLSSAKAKPEYEALQMVALRSMAKAVYTTENIGHYGLAFPFYTHFTSPIRRYPDLMVHRLLARYLAGGDSADNMYYSKECAHASEREQIAAEAERSSVKYKLVEYMQDKIGQEFEGEISGLTDWGMYVEISPEKIEGMVPLREIQSDFYDFDEKNYRVTGRRYHRVYGLGDKVRIRVKATNLEQKLLDYELIEDRIDRPEHDKGRRNFRRSSRRK